MKKGSLPSVVIVGRTNVGKSTLFNRLSVDIKSLTLDYEGVTRDFLSDIVCWQNRCFNLIDTGGVSLRKTLDPITERVRNLGLSLLETADIVLFVCDSKVGILPEDREIAKLLHKLNKKTILVVNKIDTEVGKEHFAEFHQLGFDSIVPVSAQHGIGIADLLEALVVLLPKEISKAEEEPITKVIILGKPNVGKSSLLNLLLQQERAIVADVAGTTREPITEPVRFYQEDIFVTDTPGLRRKRKVTEPIEELMVKSALRRLEDAEIALLVIDVSEGRLADQELKLAFYAFEKKHKGLIILFNKSDLLDEEKKKQLEWNLKPYEHLLKKIPQLYISCKTEQNIGKILPLIKKVAERYAMQLSDDDITHWFKEALRHKPLYRQNELLQLYIAKQVATRPIAIALFVNHPQFFGPTQFGFFDRILRKHVDLFGVPVRLFARKKGKK